MEQIRKPKQDKKASAKKADRLAADLRTPSGKRLPF